ncbi:hypothetical protein ACIRSF_23040 [Streptomyces rubiginosohelvolus]|uniref:hypothetical protein n=1 Tax=Streptomyces TaxID=1883 RepID=UPI00211D2AA7|nr:hypothetical protein [Streptomyces sp. gb14]
MRTALCGRSVCRPGKRVPRTCPTWGRCGELGSREKTTARPPDEWEGRRDAGSSATGVSKAELVRRGIAPLLDSAERPKRSREPPVFGGGRSRTPDEMDDAVGVVLADRYRTDRIFTLDQRDLGAMSPLTPGLESFRILPADC